MTLRYLIDEHVSGAIVRALRQREPWLVVWRIGEAGAPGRGTPDPALLAWCETHDFILVTDNRRSMPAHLATHLQAGRHVPGIFILGTGLSMGEIIDTLIDAAVASLEDEHRDQIRYLQSLWVVPSGGVILVRQRLGDRLVLGHRAPLRQPTR